MVLIKVSEVPSNREGLKERVRRAWRITSKRLEDQDTVIAVYKSEILAVYKLLGYENDEIEPKRMAFQLEEIESDLKGKKIVTKTANPCTIINKLEFK
ncbi:MAG: hypothetical protein ACRC7R_06800 [Sarcina sp.]